MAILRPIKKGLIGKQCKQYKQFILFPYFVTVTKISCLARVVSWLTSRQEPEGRSSSLAQWLPLFRNGNENQCTLKQYIIKRYKQFIPFADFVTVTKPSLHGNVNF